jgi:hypothetical protein
VSEIEQPPLPAVDEWAQLLAVATATYQWGERRFYRDWRCPENMVWSVREAFSYGNDLERFIPHLLAMADGLTNASFSDYDYYDDKNGVFVIGLRPATPDDMTEAQRRAEDKERRERAMLAELKERYPDG